MVQWLGLGTFTIGAQVRSLIRELRSPKPCSMAKKKKKKNPRAGVLNGIQHITSGCLAGKRMHGSSEAEGICVDVGLHPTNTAGR